MKVRVIKTVRGKRPMQEMAGPIPVLDDNGMETPLITVFPEIEYQEIEGFGGAFTEAASTTLDKLGEENRKKVLEMYFDPEKGIGYNLGRVHINSCDFSLGNYTYVDDNDNTLETFQIKRDEKSVIPMIRAAQEFGEIDFVVIMVKHNEIKAEMSKLVGKVVLDCHKISDLPGVYHL